MKQAATLFFGLMLAATAAGQVDREAYERQREAMRQQFNQSTQQARQQYDEARRKAEAEYAAFREKANAEYAAFMERAWRPTRQEPAKPKPKEPAAPKVPQPSPNRLPSRERLPQSEVVPKPAKLPRQPEPAIPEPAPSAPTMQFALYGTPCQVHADRNDLRFKLPSVDERGAASAWKQLSQERYDGLLHDCLEQRKALGLSDWGYLQLLLAMSEQLLGKGSNEAVLLQMYLYVQSGYKARLAKQNGRLVLLVPFNRNIYNYSYVMLDGVPHYVLSTSKQGTLEVCEVGFPKEQVSNILMAELPKLTGKAQAKRTFAAERFGTLRAPVGVDKALIDYVNDYPLSDAWDYYTRAGLSEGVKSDLYPTLRSQLKDKSQRKAAAMLLDFVQTAFQYATDQEQFGYERPLFGDESFHYPKNDCEDRSILYAILVRDLLGLEVVLVHWPGHLGTAVHFAEDGDGDYFTVKGKQYTVCDPTYIGAGVGETMPQFKGTAAKLVEI